MNFIKYTGIRVYFSTTPNKYNNNYVEEVLVGLLLSDGWLEKSHVNARFRIELSDKSSEFFFDVYKLLCFFCTSNTPTYRERHDKRTDKVYKSLLLTTRALPYFNYFYDLFYVNKIKSIPINIYELLTPVSLAFWVIDGYKYNAGVALATNSFSVEENELLIDALNKNFGFNSWIIDDHGKPSIYIPKQNLIQLQNLISKHIHYTILYKIHI